MPKTPKYLRIASIYRDKIVSGELSPGMRLPSRREMMDLHAISRATADEVTKVLLQENLVVSRPRSGMVIAERHHVTTLDRVRSRESTGRALAKDESSDILFTGRIPCPAHIAARMGVDEGDEILVRERVTKKKGLPVGMSCSYYPKEVADLTPELEQQVSMPRGSRETAAERMGSPARLAKNFTIARMSTKREMELLGIGKMLEGFDALQPVPVQQVTRVVTLVDGRVVEVATKVTRGDIEQFFPVLLSGD